VKQAIDSYKEYLEKKGNKALSRARTESRLLAFFNEDVWRPLAEMTPSRAERLYAALQERISDKTGRNFSVDSQRNMLSEAKTFFAWCGGRERRWLRGNRLAEVKGIGKRVHGKEQLRIDEARSWKAKALDLADAGEGGAVAALMSLLMGMRCSEIISRVARDVDDDGRLLWIPEGKTKAGRRTLEVPELLRPYLVALATGKQPGEALFGQHWRDWPRKWVRRICGKAGVTTVTAHGMRGLHASLAREAGATGHLVAAALGHTSERMAAKAYTAPASEARAKQRAAMRVLNGGKK
jgi:integrase